MKIHYEPHPVSPERKAELRAQGLRILDAQFAPAGEAPEPVTREAIASMPKADVLELLAAHGVEGAEGPVAELRAKLIAIMFVGA